MLQTKQCAVFEIYPSSIQQTPHWIEDFLPSLADTIIAFPVWIQNLS